MSELLKINVNDHTERKGQLTYLSWAWAWAEVLKIDPGAKWSIEPWPPNDTPFLVLPDGSVLVCIHVTIKGDTKAAILPVMNHKNQAVKNPDAFAINTAVMRCLAKAIAMHGLGLYIYAGEDLPEGEEEKPAEKPIVGHVHSPAKIAWEAIQPEQQEFLRKVAKQVTGAMPDAAKALDILEMADLENDDKAGLWYLLDSSTRSGLKKAAEKRHQPTAAA